jgi:hypothetical protein
MDNYDMRGDELLQNSVGLRKRFTIRSSSGSIFRPLSGSLLPPSFYDFISDESGSSIASSHTVRTIC